MTTVRIDDAWGTTPPSDQYWVIRLKAPRWTGWYRSRTPDIAVDNQIEADIFVSKERAQEAMRQLRLVGCSAEVVSDRFLS